MERFVDAWGGGVAARALRRIPIAEVSALRDLGVAGERDHRCDGPKRILRFRATHGIDSVYIECASAMQVNQPALIGFLEAAANNGLTTELLFGDARWVLPGSGYPYQGYAVSLVSGNKPDD
jgi:hypothetical protein